MEPLWEWLTSSASGHRDGKAIRAQLPYKASVSRRRADQKCTFWPTFPFVSPLGSLFPAFCAFFLKSSLFSAFTHTGTPVHRNKLLLQHHRGCKTTALSEAVFQDYVELSTAWGCCWTRWLGNASLLTLLFIYCGNREKSSKLHNLDKHSK